MSHTIQQPGDLETLIVTWINTETWNESREVLKANAEHLLSDEALALLDAMLAEKAGEDEDDDAEGRILRQHRAILQQARSDSVDAAYADLLKPPPAIDLETVPESFRNAIRAVIEATSAADLLQQLVEYPVLLTSEAITIIDTLLDNLQQAGQEDAVKHIQARYETLQQVMQQIELAKQPIPDDLAELLGRWIDTDTWNESREFLETHADRLLTDEASQALDVFLARSVGQSEKTLATLFQHRVILEKARTESIDAAYAPLLKPSPLAQVLQSLSTEFRDGIQAMIDADSPAALIQQLQKHPVLLMPEATAAIDTLLEALRQTGQNNIADLINERYETLKQVIEASRDPLNLAFNVLVNATSATLRRVIDQHPLLLEEETLQAFDDLATRAEQAGDTVMARRLRLRLDEVRYIRRKREQPVPADERDMGYDATREQEPVEVRTGHHSIAMRDNYGPVQQNNVDYHLELSEKPPLPPTPENWQRPAGPSLAKEFVGREKELEELSQYLIAGEGVTISGVMLHGMAGIGKTYLAKKLAIDVQSYFPGGVITVELGENIISEERAQDALRKLASHAFGGKMDQLGRHLQPSQVANWLQATAPGRLLVIIDDVWNDKVLRFFKEALPADAVHLVTTRNANIAWALGGRKYPLNRLTDEDSITLLEKRLGWLDYTTYLPALKKLVSLLERHALALDIIAACIKEPYRLQDTLDALEKGVGHERLSQLKLPEGEERDECREIAGVELLLYDS